MHPSMHPSMHSEESSWHEYYMNIAVTVSSRANCKGSRVGAVIVLENRIVSTGYNGTPEGMTNCLNGGCYRCEHRNEFGPGNGYDLCICVHAEQNALLSAARFGISVNGGALYTTTRPCFGCCKEMLQAKIYSVYYLNEWIPTAQSRDQYEKLLRHFPGGVHRLPMSASNCIGVGHAETAGPEEKRVVDETGHEA
jgi:dCMP deaminase